MHFEANGLYHLYNRSNRNFPVFYSRKNYLYFLTKVRKDWPQFFDIFSYCLMPTHFHFMIKVKNIIITNAINDRIGRTLSSYTQAINKQENLHGSLFQLHTKNKDLFEESLDYQNILNPVGYGLICFNYIHQNPIKDGLVKDLSDWEFSSYLDYAGLRNGTLCNIKMAEEYFGFKRGEEFVDLCKMITPEWYGI